MLKKSPGIGNNLIKLDDDDDDDDDDDNDQPQTH